MLGDVKFKIRQKMESRGIPASVTEGFLRLCDQSTRRSAYVPLEEVVAPDANLIFEPPANTEELNEFEERGRDLLQRVGILKLNGGRSTTMGGRMPKGVLKAKDGLCYLEIAVRQVKALNEKWKTNVPLILMNSFFTHDPTMDLVANSDISIMTFIQNEVPRLQEGSLCPLETGTEEDWAPPGHGDVFASLHRHGLLDNLIKQGIRWIFISNLDNLAASVEPWILGIIDRDNIDFLMEVTRRTPVDRKGGTLVVRDGKLDLLEIAQVSPAERNEFMDIDRFSVFNTNNVWVDLNALSVRIKKQSLELPLIQNHKKVMDAKVIQLETAMGAAIGLFPRAKGLRVDRNRFFPTKKVSDLFILQSDACVLDSMYSLRKNPMRPDSLPYMPRVFFGPEFLDFPEQFCERFEDSCSVSLVYANELEVTGSVYFERNVAVKGIVKINVSPGETYRVPSGATLCDGAFP